MVAVIADLNDHAARALAGFAEFEDVGHGTRYSGGGFRAALFLTVIIRRDGSQSSPAGRFDQLPDATVGLSPTGSPGAVR
ncbi:hypothetical protein GCM10009422_17260 [Brevundimonas kwangchunensis]|uniref:Uncharacterized protein n=1 Tax=Brevundimonas kwangchunensis TaxID=322163 RepID=A0ABN1GWJ4_9CAUL